LGGPRNPFGRPPGGSGARFGTFWEPFCLVVAQTEAKSKENAYLDCVSRHVFGVWPKSGLISGESQGYPRFGTFGSHPDPQFPWISSFLGLSKTRKNALGDFEASLVVTTIVLCGLTVLKFDAIQGRQISSYAVTRFGDHPSAISGLGGPQIGPRNLGKSGRERKRSVR